MGEPQRGIQSSFTFYFLRLCDFACAAVLFHCCFTIVVTGLYVTYTTEFPLGDPDFRVIWTTTPILSLDNCGTDVFGPLA